MYLPPYLPDLNPIKESFSILKAYIQHHGAEFQECVESKQKEHPFMFLYEALHKITPKHAQGWMKDSGYL